MMQPCRVTYNSVHFHFTFCSVLSAKACERAMAHSQVEAGSLEHRPPHKSWPLLISSAGETKTHYFFLSVNNILSIDWKKKHINWESKEKGRGTGASWESHEFPNTLVGWNKMRFRIKSWNNCAKKLETNYRRVKIRRAKSECTRWKLNSKYIILEHLSKLTRIIGDEYLRESLCEIMLS